MDNKSIKDFSLAKRRESLGHAIRGLILIFRTQHNAWIHVATGLGVVFVGIVYELSAMEWIAITFAIGLVIFAEAVNTAIEIDIDLTSPEYHPYAKDTKDVAAGAVLITGIIALVVGLIIFLPKILLDFHT